MVLWFLAKSIFLLFDSNLGLLILFHLLYCSRKSIWPLTTCHIYFNWFSFWTIELMMISQKVCSINDGRNRLHPRDLGTFPYFKDLFFHTISDFIFVSYLLLWGIKHWIWIVWLSFYIFLMTVTDNYLQLEHQMQLHLQVVAGHLRDPSLSFVIQGIYLELHYFPYS